VGSESNRTGVLRRSSRDSRSTHTKRKGHVKTEKVIIFKPRREVSAGTNPASTLILDFQNWEIINVCCLSHPVCGILPRQPKHTNMTGYSQRAIAK